VNFVMQVGLLYVVGDHIMRKHTEWVSSVAHLKHHAWYHVVNMGYNVAPGKCRGKDSPLCHDHGDGISCTPLSVNVLSDWNRLDINGDGVWSREEAENPELHESVQCEFDVDLSALYQDVITTVNESHALAGRRDTNLIKGVALHKAYLNWFMHKPLLCSYGDQDMCGSLFERGFFDEALRQESSAEFNDTKSAVKYCTNLLQYECFNILPNTYRVWRSKSNQQCGAKIFDQIEYHSPVDDKSVMTLLHVDFRKRLEYSTTKTPHFRLFLGILLVTFLSVMALELRSISKSFMWSLMFPSDDTPLSISGRTVDRQSVQITKTTGLSSRRSISMGSNSARSFDQKDVQMSIHAVRKDHLYLVMVMTLLRLMLWFFLMWSGIMFLTGPPRYLNLIFDALSLLFIFEIDELLYKTMLRHEFKEDHMQIANMKVPQWHGGWCSGSMTVVGDIFRFLAVIAFAGVIVYTYCQTELNPLLDSLECLCLGQGERCQQSNMFTKVWWDNYWSTVMPASNTIIDQLRLI